MWRVDVELRGRVVEQRGTKCRGKPREWSSTDQVLQATSSEAAPVSLEAQAHANTNLENLSLHAGEDAGAKCNIDAPGHHHAAQMTAHQRIVSAPLFFPRREVHMVSVWLSRHRFTSRKVATLPERWTPSFGQLSGQVKVDSRFMFLSRFRLR